MFDYLMESIIVSFSLGAVVGAIVASQLMRLHGSVYDVKNSVEEEPALAKIRIRRD